MKFDQVILIGVGGTGSHLLEPLARLLAFHPEGTRNWILIDGDTYEEKNQTRQLFRKQFIGLSKAKAAKAALEELGIEKLAALEVSAYVDKVSFRQLILDGIEKVQEKNLLIVMAVDNHATRRDIIAAVDDAKLDNFVVVDPGNGLDKGETCFYVRQKGQTLTNPHPFQKYPDIDKPKDRIPGGCFKEQESTPQLLVANASAALSVLWNIQAMLDEEPWFEEVHFDIRIRNDEPPFRGFKMAAQGMPVNKKEAVKIELPAEVEAALGNVEAAVVALVADETATEEELKAASESLERVVDTVQTLDAPAVETVEKAEETAAYCSEAIRIMKAKEQEQPKSQEAVVPSQ
jgi:hypothetical protein